MALSDKSVLKISVASMLEWFAIQGVFLSTTALYVDHHNIIVIGLEAEGMSGLFMEIMMLTKGSSTLVLAQYIDEADTRTIFSLGGAFMGGILLYNLVFSNTYKESDFIRLLKEI